MTKHSLILVDKNDFRKDYDCFNLNNINTSMDVVRTADVIYLSDGINSSILKDRTGLLQYNLINRFKAFKTSEADVGKYRVNIDKFLFIKKYRVCFEDVEIFKTYNKKLAYTMEHRLIDAHIRGIRYLINN